MLKKLVSEPFLKNLNWACLWINSLKFYIVCFYLYAKLRAIDIYWNYATNHLLLPKIKLMELASLSHFLYSFWGKLFLLLFLLIDHVSLSGCLYFVRYQAICLLQLVCDVTTFEINLIYLIKPFFLHGQNVMTKHKHILRMKKAFKMKWKVFFIKAFNEANNKVRVRF